VNKKMSEQIDADLAHALELRDRLMGKREELLVLSERFRDLIKRASLLQTISGDSIAAGARLSLHSNLESVQKAESALRKLEEALGPWERTEDETGETQ
jgi:hypothetical protein